MKKTAALICAIVLAAAVRVFSQSSVGSVVSSINDEIKTSLAVTQVLGSQMKAWNNHDLDAFMAGYWNSPDLTFFSDGQEQHGWQATLERYKAKYASPGHEMGKLEFSNMRVVALGASAAFVRGEWHLTMPGGKTPHGLFTLVFRKFSEGWKIVHDHTSTTE